VTLCRVWPSGRVLLWSLAALVSLSRVYVGVHYPLDVIAGVALGIICGLIALRLSPRARDAPPSAPDS
jgi:undecaprenyl-diphosphatase